MHGSPKEENLTTWFLNRTFKTAPTEEEESIGKMEYVPDPTPTENKEGALIYLYNTHQTEEYYIDLLMEHDITPSVMTASYILREKLNGLGLKTMVETKNMVEYLKNQNWNYNQSYRVSRHFMEQAKQKNPTLTYFIDLHRDSISYSASTLKENDTTYAKVMFVIGIDHENYTQNKELAQKISEAMDQEKKGISRGILEKGGKGNNGIYNQDFHSNTILIEVGSTYNTITEVSKTMEVLAKSIKKVVG